MATPETNGTISKSMTAQIARRLTGLPQRSHTPVSPPSALWGLQRTKCPSSLQELVCAWALHFKRHYQDLGSPYLRILVEKLHVRVSRRAIEIEVVLLHIFAVVAFAVC